MATYYIMEESVRGIFSIKCIRNSNRIKIKHLENVSLKKHEYIADTLIDDFKVMPHVVGGIYQCNITDVYLMSSKTQPVFYINVTYERPLKKYLLYRVYLCFTITSEIVNVKDLLKNEIEGKYSLELAIEGKRKELTDKINEYPGDNKMHEK